MAKAIVRVQKNKNITLPTWLIKLFHVAPGDYVEVEETKQGVVLRPKKLIDPSQAFFWSKEWQKGEAEAEEDIQKGRVKKFKGSRDLLKDLRD